MKQVDSLIEQLDNNNFDEAEESVIALAEMGNRVSDYIIERLEHETRGVVIANLLRVLGRIGDKAFVPILLEHYRNSDSGTVRVSVCVKDFETTS